MSTVKCRHFSHNGSRRKYRGKSDRVQVLVRRRSWNRKYGEKYAGAMRRRLLGEEREEKREEKREEGRKGRKGGKEEGEEVDEEENQAKEGDQE